VQEVRALLLLLLLLGLLLLGLLLLGQLGVWGWHGGIRVLAVRRVLLMLGIV
jgi:hypothetical protein